VKSNPKLLKILGSMNKLLTTITLLCFYVVANAQSLPAPEVLEALAPAGELRAALYLGGPTNVIVDPMTGEMSGVGYEIGEELARRLGVPYEPVIYQTPKLLVDDVNSGNWDVAFIARSSSREEIMNFTEIYLSLEQGFLVLADSPIETMSDVDRPGIRVGVPEGGSVIPRVARVLTGEKLVEVGMPNAAALMSSGTVDVFSANKGNLFAISDQLPGSRVLDGHFTVDEFALGTAKEREVGMPFVREFIKDVKSEGLVEAAGIRAGIRGAIE
jgi:polar amino acid transport system substrate-binding protein